MDITLATGEVITATDGHPFYLPNEKEWMDAGDLTTEQVLLDLVRSPLGIEGISLYSQQARVYNLTVNNDHTYYVGESGVLSHNCKPLNGIDMDHILRGTKGGGWHHRPNGVNQSGGYKIIKVLEKPSSSNMPYRLLVQAPGGKPKASTFWPNSWSGEKIKNVINEVYISQVAIKGLGKGRHIVDSPYGFKIELRIVSNGKGGLFVDTAFPNIKR